MVFNLDFSALQKDLEEDDWEEVEFQLKKKKLGTSIPRDEDLHGAAQALIRLQDVYELDIRDLSKGRILSCVIQLIHLIRFLTLKVFVKHKFCKFFTTLQHKKSSPRERFVIFDILQ